MADSTLSTKYSDIRKAIAHFLGFGLTSGNWSSDEIETIEMILKRGLRQFYYPPRIYDSEPPHEWSFLKPVTSLATVSTYATGTVAVTDGICTIAGGTWPTWAATHGTLTIGTTEYPVVSWDNDTELTVTGDDVDAGTSFSLAHNGNYDLPDNHGGIEGSITFDPSENKPDILVTGEGRLRSLRRDTSSSYPQYAAIRPKPRTANTTGQRFEVMFWPIPDNAYTLYYKMLVLPDTLISDEYAYGSAVHAETIEASCLAIAEMQEDEVRGPKYEYFKDRLTASIAHDKRANSGEYFGYNGDNSDHQGRGGGRHSRPFTVTYKGQI